MINKWRADAAQKPLDDAQDHGLPLTLSPWVLQRVLPHIDNIGLTRYPFGVKCIFM